MGLEKADEAEGKEEGSSKIKNIFMTNLTRLP